MLKDRITLTQNGFFIIKEQSDTQKEVFYGTYRMKDDPETIPEQQQPLRYWDPNFAAEAKISDTAPCVYVAEKEGDRIVEACHFIKKNPDREKKPRLLIYTEKAKWKSKWKYGRGAYLITISWPDSAGEALNNKYIFLAGSGGEHFPFLRDVIKPLSGHKEPEDQYVYLVPEEEDPAQFHVEVLPALRERYDVEIEEEYGI